MGVLETTTWKAKRALLTINLIVEYKPQIGMVCVSPPPPEIISWVARIRTSLEQYRIVVKITLFKKALLLEG